MPREAKYNCPNFDDLMQFTNRELIKEWDKTFNSDDKSEVEPLFREICARWVAEQESCHILHQRKKNVIDAVSKALNDNFKLEY